MKLVINANVLFALAKPTSIANEILAKEDCQLFTPDYAFLELTKYKEEIMEKSGINEFKKIIDSLKNKVTIIKIADFAYEIRKVSKEIPDEKDVPYLALSYKLGIPIWSNDRHFKQQYVSRVITTEELISLISA